jgi:hypothetical protein
LKKEIKEKLDYKWFTQFYIYDIDGISTMVYYTLRNPIVMKHLLTKTGDDTYFALGSNIGMAMTTRDNVDDFGHIAYSMTQTVFITQQIIRKGIDGVATFYKSRNAKHLYVVNKISLIFI